MRTLGSWRGLLRLLRGSGHAVAASVAISLAQALLLAPIAFLIRRVFDTSIPDGDTASVIWQGALILALLLGSSALGLLTRWLSLRATKRAIAQLRMRLLEKLALLPRSFFDRTDLGTLHSMIVQDTERLDIAANTLVSTLLPAGIISAVLCAILFALSPLLALVVLLAIPAMMLASRPLGRLVRERTRVWQRVFDRFSSQSMLSLRAATLTKLHGAERAELERRGEQIDEVREAGRRVSWSQTAHGGLNNAIASVVGVIVLVAGGVAVAEGRLSLGDLISFYAVLGLLRAQLGLASLTVPQAISGTESLARLEDLLAEEGREPYADGTRRIDYSGAVELRHARFSYSPGVPVLRGVDLTVEPGEVVLLLGPNGAGKSTVLNLIAGLYEPDSGEVLADGVPLADLDMIALRSQMGVVAQDPLLLPASVHDNIAFGRPEIRTDQVETAARRAGATEFIAALPDGYATSVGDDGVLLSGGQRQRIAIARALLGEPALLMLDEPTTHLDHEGLESLVASLRGENTPAVLLISHEPSLAETADRVLELSGGRVAESTGSAFAPGRTAAR